MENKQNDWFSEQIGEVEAVSTTPKRKSLEEIRASIKKNSEKLPTFPEGTFKDINVVLITINDYAGAPMSGAFKVGLGNNTYTTWFNRVFLGDSKNKNELNLYAIEPYWDFIKKYSGESYEVLRDLVEAGQMAKALDFARDSIVEAFEFVKANKLKIAATIKDDSYYSTKFKRDITKSKILAIIV